MKITNRFALFFLIITSCASNESNSSRFNHVALEVSNIEKSIEFYSTAFGLTLTKRIKQLEKIDTDGKVTNFDVNLVFLKFPDQNFVYELSEKLKTDSLVQSPLLKHIGIDVKNIEKAFNKAVSLGAEIISPIQFDRANDIEAKQAFIRGLDGEVIELLQIISGEF